MPPAEGIEMSEFRLFIRNPPASAVGRKSMYHVNTSRRCNACGHVAAENRKSQAVFCCVACGHTANADVNAAKNIAAGCAVTARGGPPLGEPEKREPTPTLAVAS